MAVRDGGMEVEYDFAKQTPAGDRASEWRFPARIFEPSNGPMQLLNAAELEGRVDGWLKAAGLTRAACGQWIFTWNAFRIECDPQSVIDSLEAFDLDSVALQDGVLYRDPLALAPAPLTRKRQGADGATFVAELAIDPDVVRRQQAQSDVVVAAIAKHEKMTVDDALRQRAGEAIAGTIAVTFETDASGRPQERTRAMSIEIKAADDHVETRKITETVVRRLMPREALRRPPVSEAAIAATQ